MMHSEQLTEHIVQTLVLHRFVDTAVVGYLMQKEIDFLGNAVNNPVRPFVAILGGAKVSIKDFMLFKTFLRRCDTLIIGGGMAYTFMTGLW